MSYYTKSENKQELEEEIEDTKNLIFLHEEGLAESKKHLDFLLKLLENINELSKPHTNE